MLMEREPANKAIPDKFSSSESPFPRQVVRLRFTNYNLFTYK